MTFVLGVHRADHPLVALGKCTGRCDIWPCLPQSASFTTWASRASVVLESEGQIPGATFRKRHPSQPQSGGMGKPGTAEAGGKQKRVTWVP